MTNLKLYGLQRSCTNVAKYLVEQAFPGVKVWHDGPVGSCAWKHGPPMRLDAMDGYLLCVKHPLAWIDSMMRYRPAPIPVLAEVWAIRIREYVEFYRDADCAWVRHEGLVRDHMRVLTELDIGVPVPVDLPQQLGRGGDDVVIFTGAPFNREHYESEAWRKRFPPATVEQVREIIGSVAGAGGYEI